MIGAAHHLQGVGMIREATGEEIMKRMAIWTAAIPT